MTRFPSRVVVVGVGEGPHGVAIYIEFEMARKNNYGYPAFLDAHGRAEINRDELLSWFDQDWSLGLMDYVEPIAGFTGRVVAKVLTMDELAAAVTAYELYKKYTMYPAGYESLLRAAYARGQVPTDYQLHVELCNND